MRGGSSKAEGERRMPQSRSRGVESQHSLSVRVCCASSASRIVFLPSRMFALLEQGSSSTVQIRRRASNEMAPFSHGSC